MKLDACLKAFCRENAQKVQLTCVTIDTQSIKHATRLAPRGFDAGKLAKGRKWLALVDILASRVVPANVSDAAAIAF